MTILSITVKGKSMKAHIPKSKKYIQSGKLKRQPADFPPCFSKENPLIPRLALLFEEPCPLASGWLPLQHACLI